MGQGEPGRASPWARLLPLVVGAALGAGGVLLGLTLADGGGSAGSGGSGGSATTLAGAGAGAGGGASTTTVAPGPGVTTTLPLGQLSPAAQELVALADKSRRLEFHARYEARGVQSRSGQAYEVDLELWNRGPEVRRDLAIASEGQRARTTDIRTEKLVLRCAKPKDDGTWQCATLPIGSASDPGGVAFGLAPGALSGRTVVARDERVADRAARCFSLEGGDGASAETLCFSPEGIPLRVTSGAAVLELASLELSVSGDDVFEPPARPVGA